MTPKCKHTEQFDISLFKGYCKEIRDLIWSCILVQISAPFMLLIQKTKQQTIFFLELSTH